MIRLALDEIENEPELVPHFFRYARGSEVLRAVITEAEKGGKWLSVEFLGGSWEARGYLNRVADEYVARNDYEGRKTLLEKIFRPVANAAANHGIYDENIGWCLVYLISRSPANLIEPSDIRLLKPWLGLGLAGILVDRDVATELIPHLLSDETSPNACLELIDISTEIRCEPPKDLDFGSPEARSRMATDGLMVLLRKKHEEERNIALRLGEKCGVAVVRVLWDRLAEALSCDRSKDRWSTIWRSAIAEDARNRSHIDVYLVLTVALRDAIIGSFTHPKFDPTEVMKVIQGMLDGKHKVLHRIAIHICDEKFDTCGHLLIRRIGRRFFDDEMRPEMYRFLDHHFADLSDAYQTRIINTIERLQSKGDGENRERRTNRWRQTWLSSIRGKGNGEVDRLYDRYRMKTGIEELEDPDLPTRMSDAIYVSQTSPMNSEEMLQRPMPELVNFLNDFQPPPRSFPTDGQEISFRGVQEALQKAVEAKPDRFWSERKTIAGLNAKYISAVVRGFTEVWKRGGELEWRAVLDICNDCLDDGLFENDDEDSEQLVSEIARLIREGTLRDENPLTDENALDMMEEVLRFALPCQKSSVEEDSGDAVNRAINRARGHLIEALLLYTRRRKLILGDKNEAEFPAIWGRLEPLYDEQLKLDGSSRGHEFRALVCHHAPLLLYLGGSWFENHLDEIFKGDDDAAWRAAMEGYIYVTTVYEALYKPLRDRGHLWKAMKEDRYRERIVQQVAVAYTADTGNWERLDDDTSLIRRILEEWRIDDIRNIVTFFWRHRRVDYLADKSERLKEPAIRLWRWISKNMPMEEADSAAITVELAQLAVYLDEITEESKKWLVDAVKAMQDGFHAHQFIQELARLADASPTDAAEVFIVLLDAQSVPYPDNEVRSLVRKLTDKGLRDRVNEIYERYARKGIDPERLGGVL